MFLELEHGSCFVKRREPLAESEVRNVMLEAGVQTADDVLDEIVAGDRRVEVAEAISHGFHARAVCEHRYVALDKALKFCVEVDDACVLVRPEQITDAALERVRGVVIGGDGDEEVGGDAIVKPREMA